MTACRCIATCSKTSSSDDRLLPLERADAESDRYSLEAEVANSGKKALGVLKDQALLCSARFRHKALAARQPQAFSLEFWFRSQGCLGRQVLVSNSLKHRRLQVSACRQRAVGQSLPEA